MESAKVSSNDSLDLSVCCTEYNIVGKLAPEPATLLYKVQHNREIFAYHPKLSFLCCILCNIVANSFEKTGLCCILYNKRTSSSRKVLSFRHKTNGIVGE
ncbi:hypothetical protein [Paenibacillus sp. CECT 9249]|uniref:hypothetical protein n=1 Tax=Paenibacillus sp. CECT 9249 TaxID=2845385 RepID=UPI001E2E844F|nr:hypothetical protein [Paenibacillus sp. CECT 9249]